MPSRFFWGDELYVTKLGIPRPRTHQYTIVTRLHAKKPLQSGDGTTKLRHRRWYHFEVVCQPVLNCAFIAMSGVVCLCGFVIPVKYHSTIERQARQIPEGAKSIMCRTNNAHAAQIACSDNSTH